MMAYIKDNIILLYTKLIETICAMLITVCMILYNAFHNIYMKDYMKDYYGNCCLKISTHIISDICILP